MTPINLGIIGQDGPTLRTCRRQSTSAEAYEAVRPHITAKGQKVLECLKAAPATDEEVQQALAMNPSTERPRRKELADAGLVVDSGEKRFTASGCKAIVWKAV